MSIFWKQWLWLLLKRLKWTYPEVTLPKSLRTCRVETSRKRFYSCASLETSYTNNQQEKKTNGHTMLQASFLKFWCKTLSSGFIAVLRRHHYSVQIQHSAYFRGSEVKCNLHQQQSATIALEYLSIPPQQPNESAEQPGHSSLAIFPKQQSQSVLAFVFKAAVSHIFFFYLLVWLLQPCFLYLLFREGQGFLVWCEIGLSKYLE